MKKILLIVITILFIIGCSRRSNPIVLQMATTTSLNDSGILDELSKDFYDATNIKLEWVSVGSGEAINLAKTGDVDLIFVHSPKDEHVLVDEGYSLGRNLIMTNNFLIVGPNKLEYSSLDDLVNNISNNELFVSRSDNSGTYKKELELFKTTPKKYIETGSGMGDTLMIADEKNGFTLVDYATWLELKSKTNLVEVFYDKSQLVNEYSIHIVSSKKVEGVNEKNANKFLEWINGEGSTIIKEYGKDKYNMSIFEVVNE